MNSLIRAEALKLRSTRTFWAVTLGALVLIAVAAAAATAASRFTPGDDPARQALAPAGLAQTFALILGVLAVTSEFRHGTITPAVLITPKRTPLLAAKIIALTAGGLVLGLLAFGEAAAIVLPVLSARHVASQVDGGAVAAIIAGGAIATALAAALGVGVGAVVRNQVGAVIAALGLLYVLEPMLSIIPGIGAAVQRFGVGGLATGASGTTGFPSSAHILGQVPAALLLGSYALVVVIAGTMLFRRLDVAAK
jgi:ABC-2 type transport system permease protein